MFGDISTGLLRDNFPYNYRKRKNSKSQKKRWYLIPSANGDSYDNIHSLYHVENPEYLIEWTNRHLWDWV